MIFKLDKTKFENDLKEFEEIKNKEIELVRLEKMGKLDEFIPIIKTNEEMKKEPEVEAWVKLRKVNSFLEKDKAIPYDLASWLSSAISYSYGDKKEFLKRLGIQRKRGRQDRDPEFKFKLGAYMYQRLEVDKPFDSEIKDNSDDINYVTKEKLIERLMQIFRTEDGEDCYDRTTLQNYLKAYQEALKV